MKKLLNTIIKFIKRTVCNMLSDIKEPEDVAFIAVFFIGWLISFKMGLFLTSILLIIIFISYGSITKDED